MYWPYLRSKENEVLAFRELAPTLSASNLTVPIYKPTSKSPTLRKRLDAIAMSGGRFALIVNSDDGKPPPMRSEVESLLDPLVQSHPLKAMPAIELRPMTSLGEVSSFAAKYASSQCVVVHRDHMFSAAAVNTALAPLSSPAVHVFLQGSAPAAVVASVNAVGKVLIRDGFKRHTPNGNYPPHTNFDDLVYHYKVSWDGFGDFGPLGDIFIKGGAQPSHVALHLTHPSSGPTIVCRHFVSTVSPGGTDTATKYFDALNQLCSFTGSPPPSPFDTAGVNDFLQNHAAGHYPNLGLPKRWSLKHHVEMMQRILLVNKAVPFV